MSNFLKTTPRLHHTRATITLNFSFFTFHFLFLISLPLNTYTLLFKLIQLWHKFSSHFGIYTSLSSAVFISKKKIGKGFGRDRFPLDIHRWLRSLFSVFKIYSFCCLSWTFFLNFFCFCIKRLNPDISCSKSENKRKGIFSVKCFSLRCGLMKQAICESKVNAL